MDLDQALGMVELDRLCSSSRSQLHEALVNLLQSQQPASANLSMATRATLGKRGLGQLEVAKGSLDIASDLSAMVLGRTRTALADLEAAQSSIADADARATAAEAVALQARSRAEAAVADQTAALRAAVDDATSRAAAAEARAAAAEAAAAAAEREAAAARESAAASEASATGRLELDAQLERERGVLARLAAENLLFVKRLQQSESARAEAERERAELQTRWREQTEEWFRRATDELQSQLLVDWGTSGAVAAELQQARDEAAAAASEHAREAAGAAEREAALRKALDAKSEELAGAWTESGAARERCEQLQAEAEARAEEEAAGRAELRVAHQQASEARASESKLRAVADDATVEALAGLRASLHAAEEKARVAQAVSQRARAEVSGEHNALLEAQARLDFAEEEARSLKARLDAAEREKSFLLAACNQGGKAERL